MARRSRLVAGNWKMNGSRAANAALLDALVRGVAGETVEVAVCPPFPYLAQVEERLRGTPIAWGAQNVSEHASGAYTGEVSGAMLVDFGCRYVHRRPFRAAAALRRDATSRSRRKFAAAQSGGAHADPVRRRDAAGARGGRTEDVVARQLDAVSEENAI